VKSVTNDFEAVAAAEPSRLRFLGNCVLGTDVPLAALQSA
jgi:NADPH-dependent glutamate synthase beta subunit-like oxidoreductase